MFLQDSDHIEEVTKDTLDRLVSTTDYVVVLFYSIFSEGMDEILAHLENIDDDLDEKEGENNLNFNRSTILKLFYSGCGEV